MDSGSRYRRSNNKKIYIYSIKGQVNVESRDCQHPAAPRHREEETIFVEIAAEAD